MSSTEGERLYTVTMQRPGTIITATNQVVPGIELHVEGRGGIAFVLNVPQDADTAYIDAAIRQELSKRYQIANLGTN
jgi:hypothetical protein